MKKYKYYKYNPKYGIPPFYIKAISLDHAINKAIKYCNQLNIKYEPDRLHEIYKDRLFFEGIKTITPPNKIKYKNQ